MKWYLWILIVILGLNAIAIGMTGFMLVGDWFLQRRRLRQVRKFIEGRTED